MIQCDTHYYDGQLFSTKSFIEYDLERVRNIDDNSKRVAFNKLREKLIGKIHYNPIVEIPPSPDVKKYQQKSPSTPRPEVRGMDPRSLSYKNMIVQQQAWDIQNRNVESPRPQINLRASVPSAIQGQIWIEPLNTIINSFKSQSNFDPTNRLNADDLLYLCYEKICIQSDLDFEDLLKIQLVEMNSGLCPQGRTTRLFQILIPYYDSI